MSYRLSPYSLLIITSSSSQFPLFFFFFTDNAMSCDVIEEFPENTEISPKSFIYQAQYSQIGLLPAKKNHGANNFCNFSGLKW